MNPFKKKPLPIEFIKNSFTLVSGSFASQALVLLIYPFITRLFSQSDLGAYATWLSIVDVLAILSTGKYEDSIMLGKDKSEAVATTRLAMRINTVFSLLSVVVVLVIFLCGNVGFTVFLIPPMIFFCGTTRVYKALFNYVKAFGQMALSNITNSVATVAAKLTAGVAHLTNGTLQAGSLVGQIVGNINYRIQLHKLHLPATSWTEEKAIASKHRKFPMFTMPRNFIDSFSFNLPFLFLAYYFDKSYLGLFSLAMACTFRPISFFSSAYHSVLYKNLSEKYRNRKSLKSDINRFVLTNAAIFLPMFMLGGVFAENLLEFIFGKEWGACAPYLHFVLPWIFLNLILSSLSFLPNLFSKQHIDFILNVILLVLRISVLTIGVMLADFALAIMLFSAVNTIMSIVNLAWYYAQVRSYEKTLV